MNNKVPCPTCEKHINSNNLHAHGVKTYTHGTSICSGTGISEGGIGHTDRYGNDHSIGTVGKTCDHIWDEYEVENVYYKFSDKQLKTIVSKVYCKKCLEIKNL